MKYAILSDIHANQDAFEAVLATIEQDADVLCLGDAIGYGAQPNAVVDLLRDGEVRTVIGNHDAAAVGRIGTEDFNAAAAQSARWTGLALSEENRAWIRELDYTIAIDDPDLPFLLVHGSPHEPRNFNYVFDGQDAKAAFRAFPERLCFIGHSHRAAVFAKDGPTIRGMAIADVGRLAIDHDVQYIINAGSIGQPRDGNPAACYAVFDSAAKTVEWRRVPYDIAAAAARIRAAGLPEMNARRLARGS